MHDSNFGRGWNIRRGAGRAAVLAAACGIASIAAAGSAEAADKFIWTAVTSPSGTSGPAAPAMVNGAGMVAGSCQWTNTHGFVFTPGEGSSALTPGAGVLFIGVEGMSEQGHVLATGCIPPPSGNGTCGFVLFRHSPGAGSQRIDALPGGPIGPSVFPIIMNGQGSVALSSRSWSNGAPDALKVFTDGAGWQDLTAQFPMGDWHHIQLVAFNDAGQVLAQTSATPSTYLYTPGAGVAAAIPAGASAEDLNNAGVIAGTLRRDGRFIAFKTGPGGEVTEVDPQNVLGDTYARFINDEGAIAGTYAGGFFLHSENAGLEALPSITSDPLAGGFILHGLNAKGEFTGSEHTQVYQNIPVIKLLGQPLQRVQDVIDPAVERLVVSGVTAINDSGQFVVTGTLPGTTHTAASFLITPRGCEADFNRSGSATVQDVFDFLAAYFAGASEADMNGDGAMGVQDLFDFLAAYFRGCV